MRIRIAGIAISCAHFIEIDGEFESLHGHNLLISSEVSGNQEKGMVMDFRELKSKLKEEVDALDHKVIIPVENPHLLVERSGDYMEIKTPQKRYKLPCSDVALLPARNSTVEQIGQHIFRQLEGKLPDGISLYEVTISESEGEEAVINRIPD